MRIAASVIRVNHYKVGFPPPAVIDWRPVLAPGGGQPCGRAALGRLKGVTQTGLVAGMRRESQARRDAHTEAMVAGMVARDSPEPLVSELLQDIQTPYWECVKAVPDPRSPAKMVYPRYLIRHRSMTGF